MAVTPRTFAAFFAALVALSWPGAAHTGAPLQAPGRAFGEDAFQQGEARVEARLLARRLGQDRIEVGVLFDLDPGWHLYWRNPGATGLATELRWQVDGATPENTRWPAPIAFGEAGELQSYGYEKQVLLLTDAALPEALETARVRAEADLLVCESECIPASFRLERSLDGALDDAETDSRISGLFRQYGERVPTTPAALGLAVESFYSQDRLRPGDRFEAAIALRSYAKSDSEAACTRNAGACPIWTPGAGAFFFPFSLEDPGATAPLGLRVTGTREDAEDPRLRWIEFEGSVDPEEPFAADRIEAVLALRSASQSAPAYVEISLVPPGRAAAGEAVVVFGATWRTPASGRAPASGEDTPPSTTPASGISLAQALLLALLGGLVLNAMPCVLPVLAIKVFGVAELASRSRRELIAHGVAYTAGILASMLALAGIVIALRAAGHSVGWGFQFQEPVFAAAICAVVVAFALNLFGVYEIQMNAGALHSIGQEATGARRSFFEGLLAVALATPCTAPFLGTAVGFAFASEPIVIAAIFAAVGLGLASPYALVTFVPGWSHLLPRPGAWMLVVRGVLGFALMGTVVWLLSVFGASAGVGGVVGLVAFLVALSFGLFAVGCLQSSGRPRLSTGAALAVLALAVAGLNTVRTQLRTESAVLEGSSAGEPDSSDATRGAWTAWSTEAVEAARDAGRPVFVRFTADWCLTCKVNERAVLADASVVSALLDGRFALFVGDWTRRDDRIRAELARHGRAGVPLYLVYVPGAEEPEVLSELLTRAEVLEALREQAPRPRTAT